MRLCERNNRSRERKCQLLRELEDVLRLGYLGSGVGIKTVAKFEGDIFVPPSTLRNL